MTETRQATSARRCALTSRRTSSTCIPDVELKRRRRLPDARDRRLARLRRAGRGGPERATAIAVDDVEITEENFGSIDAIAGFVERKRGAGVRRRTARRRPAPRRPRRDPDAPGGDRRRADASPTASSTALADGARRRPAASAASAAATASRRAAERRRGGDRDLRRPARRRGVLAAQPDDQGATSSARPRRLGAPPRSSATRDRADVA